MWPITYYGPAETLAKEKPKRHAFSISDLPYAHHRRSCSGFWESFSTPRTSRQLERWSTWIKRAGQRCPSCVSVDPPAIAGGTDIDPSNGFYANSSSARCANACAVGCIFHRCEGKSLATTLRSSLHASRYLIPGFLPHPLRRHHAVGSLSLLHIRLDRALLR